MTDRLYEKYYFSRPGYVGGAIPFYNLCRANMPPGSSILEVGAGPSNPTSRIFAAIGPLTGVDVSDEVLENDSLIKAAVYDGITLPFADQSFDGVVSNWVLEHVQQPEIHFKEVRRVLRPGGKYCFRTINLHHLMPMGSRLIPRSLHAAVSKMLRKMKPEDHDPWPVVYRSNTRRRLKQLAREAGFGGLELQTIEPEPAYGRGHAALFYPMMAYERLVNSADFLSAFRIIVIGVASNGPAASGAGRFS